MRNYHSLIAAGAAVGFLGLAPALAPASENDTRRAVIERFATRFSNELYPLFSREANGCKLCHYPESPRMLRVLNSPRATFSVLLEQNLFDLRDAMAIPSRVSGHDPELRMPQVGELTSEEIGLIQRFASDLTETLNNAGHGETAPVDERFPDSLLLPYDGEDGEVRVERGMSYYQLRHSFGTLFGAKWLASSGPDPFKNKANIFGGADFKSSFETSRTVSAGYLAGLQEAAREVARRYVSAPQDALLEGFNPDVFVKGSQAEAARNVSRLYERILFRQPAAGETDHAITLVAELQGQASTKRKVRFALEVRDPQGREDRRDIDVTLRNSDASVSRFLLDQTQAASIDDPSADNPWKRVGDKSFRFEANNPDHLVRLIARPGNHVTAFDAMKFVRVENGAETTDAVVLDNLDPECTIFGEWEPIEKEGEITRVEEAKQKYEQDLYVVGSNHLETRNLTNQLIYATMALRIPSDGEYNVYLSWPAIPHATPAAVVAVYSSTPSATPAPAVRQQPPSEAFATIFFNQMKSTLDEEGETQWELFHREVYLAGESDFLQVSNRGVDSTEKVLVTDAVKFVPLAAKGKGFEEMTGGEEIIVDNDSEQGFQQSDGWAVDKLVKNSPGRGKMHGEDVLHYPPAKNGSPLKDQEVDSDKRVWARYRPIQDGKYRPGWYSIYVWTPGGHTHSDRVAYEIYGSAFSPISSIEVSPVFSVGETATLNASATYHPLGQDLTYRWTHNAHDLGLRLQGAGTPTPRFVVPSPASPRPGWAGLIEALLQHPEFLLPKDDADAAPKVKLARVALDLVGRIPTQEELRRFERTGNLDPMIDAYLNSGDFKDFFFHKTRAEFRSRGTEESDEPARLWTYIATNDLSYRELFTADYSIDPHWEKKARPAEHGPTGILTMKGFLVGKPGLPTFTYPAQVLTFAMGVQFEVSDAVANARLKVVSTTDPDSMCYSCHKLLTPLAYQRERWDVHGDYRAADEEDQSIDDSDRGVVPDYPFKGQGLGAFSTQLVKKERFVRAFINLHHDMLFHRQLRVHEDQRDDYKQLYDFALANDLRIRPLLKKMILMRYGEPYSEPPPSATHLAAR
jgi:hypothetical protein